MEKWQCSPSSLHSIIPSVNEGYIAFDVIKNPLWLYQNRKYVDCFQKGLTRVPRGLESDIEILNLDQNSITKIYQNDFDSYPKLVAITMVNNCNKYKICGSYQVQICTSRNGIVHHARRMTRCCNISS